MVVKAESLGADAVVGLRFSTSSIAQGASELFVYGTAVKIVRLQHQSSYNQPPNGTPNQSDQHQPEQSQLGQSGQAQTPVADLPRFNPFG